MSPYISQFSPVRPQCTQGFVTHAKQSICIVAVVVFMFSPGDRQTGRDFHRYMNLDLQGDVDLIFMDVFH